MDTTTSDKVLLKAFKGRDWRKLDVLFLQYANPNNFMERLKQLPISAEHYGTLITEYSDHWKVKNGTELGLIEKRDILNAKVESLSKEYYRIRKLNKTILWNWSDHPSNDHDVLVMTENLKYLAALHKNKSDMEALGEEGMKEDFYIKLFVQDQIDAHSDALKKKFRFAQGIWIAAAVVYYLYYMAARH